MSVLEMPSIVPMLAVPRYVPHRAIEDHPDVQGIPGCTRLVMAPQPPSAKNRTLRTRSALRASMPKLSDDFEDYISKTIV